MQTEKAHLTPLALKSQTAFSVSSTRTPQGLTPPGENKSTTTIIKATLKQGLLNTGQVHTQDSQRTVNYINPVSIKANLSTFVQWGATSVHPDVLPAYYSHLCVIKHTPCSWGNQPCLRKWKHMAYYRKRTTLDIPGSCLSLSKWGLQVRSIFVP